MLRQVSSRNHRAKGGLRSKNALQICILVAVCVWLLYQMKYSHDQRKAYEENFRVDERQAELTRFGRKDLPHTVDTKEKEDAEDREQDIKHEEVEDGVEGGAENHRTGRQDKVRAEEAEYKEHIAHAVDENGKKLGVLEDQEHEEQSHEAREKSFKGDDASSEVVHNSQEVDHEERTQEARERSFKADDASSAVDHVIQVKESESENELLDSSKGANLSVIHEDNQILPNNKVTTNGTVLEKIEPGVEHTTLEKKPSSSTAGESDDDMEEQIDLEIVDHIINETEPQTFLANESDNQIELRLRSRDLSKNQINVQKNHTASSEERTGAQGNQTTVVGPTIVITDVQNQTNMHPRQDLNATAKLETPRKEDSDLENAVMVNKKPDQTSRPEESEESSKTSPVTSENKVFSQESKDSLHSLTEEKRDELHNISNPLESQKKVESSKKEAAE